jgi:hypothetical protein
MQLVVGCGGPPRCPSFRLGLPHPFDCAAWQKGPAVGHADKLAAPPTRQLSRSSAYPRAPCPSRDGTESKAVAESHLCSVKLLKLEAEMWLAHKLNSMLHLEVWKVSTAYRIFSGRGSCARSRRG